MKRGRPKLSDEERKERRIENLRRFHERHPNYWLNRYHDNTEVSKANVRKLAENMVDRAKSKQADLGLPWDERITVELVMEMTLERWACAKSGEPFHDLRIPGCFPSRPWAPSLDRIDSKRGYTLDGPGKYGNLQVVCAFVNIAKGNLPDWVARDFFRP